MKFAYAAAAASFAVLAFAGTAEAGSVATRADLQTILGGPGTIENFNGFTIAAGGAFVLDCSPITSASVCNFQGPGLVVPGVSFGSGAMQWDGVNYFGSPAQEILSNAGTLTITFASAVGAVGFDLRAFAGFGATAAITVLGADDSTVIGSLSGIGLSSSGVPVFAGWADPSGIGELQLTQTGEPWSPLLENLEFGAQAATTAVPEPGTLALVGMGLLGLGAARRRRAA